MFQDAFTKLDAMARAAALADIAGSLSNIALKAEDLTILAWNVPFYPGYRLLDIADLSRVPPIRRSLLQKPGATPVMLDYTNDPIYALNQSAPIQLSAGNVLDYVRFFFRYVSSRSGAVQIAETVDDIPWQQDPSPSARKAVGRLIQPLQLLSQDDGAFTLHCCLVYNHSLFRTYVRVRTDGVVSFGDEEALVEDMPVRDMVFG